MDALTGFREIWKQNSVTEPTDRAATVTTILKGDSLIAFESALADAMTDPDDDEAPFDMDDNHVQEALLAVTTIVFPFRALENQKIWMLRYMKKPPDLLSRQMASALSRLNNYLPYFPNGSTASKFSDAEICGLLDFALPHSWRKTMDLQGYNPADSDMADLLDRCERIERNETPIHYEKEPHDNNNNNKKNKFAKSGNKNKKNGREKQPPTADGTYHCKKCGHNKTHDTDHCYILKRLEKEKGNGNGKTPDKQPYSKRTFRKEVNAITRRAGKNDGLKIVVKALKREQGRQAKQASKKTSAKKQDKKTAESESSSASDSEESMHNLELPIPRKATSTYKKALLQKKKSIFQDLVDLMTDDEDTISMNKPTAEETAFLKSIDKEEKELASKSDDEEECLK
jgi:hypothetical protein